MTDIAQQDISHILEKLKSAKVMIIGDIMLDQFCEGSVSRVSPEAPIPVLHVKKQEAHLGGAGNVARNLSALGVKSILITACGNDSHAYELEALLNKQTVVTAYLERLDDRPTTIKTRFVAGGQQLLRADWEQAKDIPDSTARNIFEHVKTHIKEVGAIILSDYGKGVLSTNIIELIIDLANDRNIPVIVDPKGEDFSIYRRANFLTPNRQELSQAAHLPAKTNSEILHACQHLIQTCGLGGILATRSEQGMSLIQQSETVSHFKARAIEVFDVAGAGDTVIAAFSACLAANFNPQEAAWLSNIAAGIVVAKVGTAVAYPDEILNSAHNDSWQENEDKVISLDSAVNRTQQWQQRGLTVGFTNGCFDLLHPGHISLIEQAAAQCDRLILGLNSDSSVKRLKGESRPIQNEVSRATVLAALAKVSLVVIFGEDTPLDLIKAIKPDVLIKGADYTIETVVGAEEVMSWGGKVYLANLIQGQSTTKTIERMSD